MAIVFEKGDLFAVEADVIAHGCNCQGVMGAGIARAFKAKFPEMYKKYSNLCAMGSLVPGDFQTWEEDDRHGVNLMTQELPGADASYRAIYISLMGVSQRITRASFKPKPIIIAMPLIGCGIGGLDFLTFLGAVSDAELMYPNIIYKIVYNDDNEALIPEYFRVDSTP